MNSSVFLECLKTKVFPKLKLIGKKHLVVLERATYYTPPTKNKRPSRSYWTKMIWYKPLLLVVVRPLICFLTGGPPEKITTSIMMDHAKRISPSPKYIVQALADSFSD